MNILVYANCQNNQLVIGLTFALFGRATVAGIDINHPDAEMHLKSMSQNKGSSAIDLVITNRNIDNIIPYFKKEMIVEIPSIHFGGFHPDVVYLSSKQAPAKPLFYLNNPTVSALALWAYINKLPLEKTLSLYSETIFEELGYMDYFDVACIAIRKNYENKKIDVSYIDRHLASRSVFMYGPLHPKFAVTLSLVYGLCEKLELKTSMPYENINNMYPDPLQNEYVWGCFPPIADKLGVPGSWFIRHNNHTFPMIKNYLVDFYKFLDQFEQGTIQFLERDKSKFEKFHNIDTVLARHI
jgi:hypothetical protein